MPKAKNNPSVKTALQALAIGVACSLPPMAASADGLAGAYLAARQASFYSDYAAAAQYFTKAMTRDPSNAELMENAMMSFVGLGDMTRAVPVARKMDSDGVKSQVSQMVLVVDQVLKEDYAGLIKAMDDGRSVGPLVDGLILAWAYLGNGEMTVALEEFDKIIKAEGMRAFGLYHKALALASVGDFEGADKIFSGDAEGPLRATRRGVFAHAQVLSQLERNDDAIELITSVFGAGTGPDVAALLADLNAGKTVPFTLTTTPMQGVAEVFFTIAGALNSEAADTYTLLYSRMTEALDPTHVGAVLLSANLLEKLEQYDLATKAYNRVPRDSASFLAAELGRAEALSSADKDEAAIEVLQQLVKSHGDQRSVHMALGSILRSQEDYAAAIKSYDRVMELAGDTPSQDWFLFYARGISFERTDQWAKAEADLRHALEINPDQPQILNYLGYSLLEKNIKLDEALTLIEQAVENEPNSGYITDSLGWALYRLGRFEEAVPVMERAAELISVDPIVTDHLGDTLWAVGRRTEANFQWRRALSYEPEDLDAERIRRKLDVGLDVVRKEEGAEPFPVVANGG